MELNGAVWKTSTSKIFSGVLLFSLSGIVGGLFAVILALSGSLGAALWIGVLTGIATILGYVLYLMGLGELQGILQGEDASAIGKVKLAAILLIIGACVSVLFSIVPLLGTIVGSIISGILNIVGCILCVMAFAQLKKSTTFPATALSGVSKLYVAYLLNLIGYGLMLTVILAVVAPILNLVAFIMILIGWAGVKNAQV
ncbi:MULTISPECIES: hypothetical protein [Culturomica]|jgi:hypothetical protein|uniref:hypothetical protein n=1 Tax=Culturomica TaxID=1926651 RepID=UPI0003366610|nr:MULTISPECIES: hypothetical protein [Odoribacteraceae]RHV97658.1 hypothetical protein DXA95_03310 [Odoribacter sp. OF09-27XD]CCZ07018.1 putative uncharacterized protein [Odoribacter sp. CAG:788]HBO27427.1 hypothetical protein [Culturomica sp.]